jgi:hypothetical protein
LGTVELVALSVEGRGDVLKKGEVAVTPSTEGGLCAASW